MTGFRLFLVVLSLFCLTSSALAKNPKAALLKAGMPEGDTQLLEKLDDLLESQDYKVETLGFEDLENLTRFDLLVLPDGSNLPAASVGSVKAFVEDGGNILALNAPLWQRSLIKIDNQWLTRDDYALSKASEPPSNVLYDFQSDDLSKWSRSGNEIGTVDATHEVVEEGPEEGIRSLNVKIPKLTSWDTFSVTDIEKPFPENHTLTVFSAKGAPGTNQLAVEWGEKDRSRWIAVIPLTTQWKRYVLKPQDFKRYTDPATDRPRTSVFNPANADKMSIGLAFTHTTSIGEGPHQYWISMFGTDAPNEEYEAYLTMISPPALDTLSPDYKFFNSTDVKSIKTRDDQCVVTKAELTVPEQFSSSYARPRGVGLNRRRDWRWIPLLESVSPDGIWRGVPATLLIHPEGKYRGGVWASFAIGDMDWYKTPEVLNMLGEILQFMKQKVYILDAGADFFTYFEDQAITLGANIVNFDDSPADTHLKVRLSEIDTQKTVYSAEMPLEIPAGEIDSITTSYMPKQWNKGGYIAQVDVLKEGSVIDTIRHEVHLWRPKEEKEYITIDSGEFILNSERWRANGINYMPSSGLGMEQGSYFEHYLHAPSYDPEVYRRDLDHVKDIGFNAVSIFIYGDMYKGIANKDQNLLDILRLLEERGIKANLSLRPGDPVNHWDSKKIEEMIIDFIDYYRLAENDTVFAYDLAWEPSFGHHRDRKKWDEQWKAWVIERYGSIENAEKDWDIPIPRDDDGKVTNPLPDQVDLPGEWDRMTAAYRRFLDFLLYKKYSYAKRVIHEVDPHHFISFRMSEAANPTYRWEGRITYDFPYLAAALDFLSPEAYGRFGTWERTRPGWFVYEYAAWAAPEQPMIWAEAGITVWDTSRKTQSEYRLKFAAESYERFYRLLISSCADGVFYWWYPGGFRYGENSDYGVINPDGTDREITRVIREKGQEFLQGPSVKPVDIWLEIDRDADPAGATGIYDEVKEEFWAAIEEGKRPGLRTVGTGTTSANAPLTAVGNTPGGEDKPLKYLDSSFDIVWVKDASGETPEVKKGESVRVKSGESVIAWVLLTNLSEATWLSGDEEGAVVMEVLGRSKKEIALPKNIKKHQSYELARIVLQEKTSASPMDITLQLKAKGRLKFGEKFTFTVIPEKN